MHHTIHAMPYMRHTCTTWSRGFCHGKTQDKLHVPIAVHWWRRSSPTSHQPKRNPWHGENILCNASYPLTYPYTYPIDNIRYKYTYVSSIFLYEIKYTYYIFFISYIMYSIRKSTRVEFMSFWKGGHHLNVYWMYLLVWVRLNVPRELAVFVGTWPFPNFMLKSGLNGLV